MGLLAQIVGNFTRVVVFPFEENELYPGDVAILVNAELRALAPLTLRNCSWFWENENCDVDVKADLKVACCSLDSKICLAFIINNQD